LDSIFSIFILIFLKEPDEQGRGKAAFSRSENSEKNPTNKGAAKPRFREAKIPKFPGTTRGLQSF
jgi:hypothetical protein